jgi:hypothetical protein
MKRQPLNDFDIGMLILVIILSILKGFYNLYIAYINRVKGDKFLLDKIENMPTFSVFNMTTFALSTLFIVLSSYFYINNKIQNELFLLVCLFMFIRGSVYFIGRFFEYKQVFPQISDNFVYNNYLISSWLMILVGIYFINIIFFS